MESSSRLGIRITRGKQDVETCGITQRSKANWMQVGFQDQTSKRRQSASKGCLVAKGCAQKYGIDYDETFLPAVRISSIRALLAIAIQNDMLIHQMDVVTAFLNGKLDEDIYMQQPDGYIEPGREHLVCKLKAFREHMESIRFKRSAADPCVYIPTADTMTIVAVYVDDLIVIAKTAEEM